MAGKAQQRVLRRQRPAVGGDVLARLVADHWRSSATTLEPIRRLGIVNESWLDQLVSGAVEPPTTAVSLITTLLAMPTSERG
jgi:hypothetical protein